jgi:hydrogenase-4 component B
MSGVMVKTAVYGLVRVVWEFAGPGPAWWGVLLIALGAASAVLGILYALMERDLKRMLAYSTVEHVGIVFISLGAASVLTAKDHPAAAALALSAALLHVLNHSIFKGLLFLGAGAVQTATGTRDLERLGGLVRRMPQTAALFLIGALAIVALPPLNGFAGEWLLFQSLLSLGSLTGTTMFATVAALAAGALALTSALALAAFVRAFGVGFLAQPRGEGARAAREVGLSMRLGMALLAVCAVALGVLPEAGLRLLRPVTRELVDATARPSLGSGNTLEAGQLSGAYAPLLVIAGLVAVSIVPWLVARVLGGRGRERVSPVWVCGWALEPRMSYSATAFAKPIRIIFQALIRPHRTVVLERPLSEFAVAAVRYDEGVHPVYERHLYRRGVGLVLALSHRIRVLQSGSIRAYLAYLFVTLVVVLVVTR